MSMMSGAHVVRLVGASIRHCPGLLIEQLTRLTYNPRRVSARVQSRPGYIQNIVNKKKVCRMRLKSVISCTRVSNQCQGKDPTQVDSSL
jgi:hypothetical protein